MAVTFRLTQSSTLVQPASHPMLRGHRQQDGFLDSAVVKGKSAAWVERASRRWVDRAGDVSLHGKGRGTAPWFGKGNRRQKGLGIGMTRLPAEHLGWRQLDDGAQVHYGDAVANVLHHTQVVG